MRIQLGRSSAGRRITEKEVIKVYKVDYVPDRKISAGIEANELFKMIFQEEHFVKEFSVDTSRIY